ncbi:hypothetical protein [Planctomyces sp. SH-PL62]|uniref:hypothetical protein n=1 Tax=Planctomyces sp. SH-PL62 TaxID=1636152 RepID=UPI00078E537F|nr:hypothetical protein [Planctomyces sp. SH-PL62]AMV40501.1 hypothetical protein VT85_23930 [Planctomyces sp. SH-PL62]
MQVRRGWYALAVASDLEPGVVTYVAAVGGETGDSAKSRRFARRGDARKYLRDWQRRWGWSRCRGTGGFEVRYPDGRIELVTVRIVEVIEAPDEMRSRI